MTSGSNPSGCPWHNIIISMDQRIMIRMFSVDFAVLDIQNATIAANKMKNFIAIL
jgi:hypothetical protein